jgi:hypothetical protein
MSEHEAATAVAEVEEPVTKDVISAQLQARQQQVHEAQQRHRELEGLATARGLTLVEVQEQLGLERWIELEQVHLERLQTESTRAQIAFDLQSAVAYHDRYIEEKKQCYQQIAEALGGLYAAFQHLANVDREQKEPLQALRSPSGQPFAPISAEELLGNVVSRMSDSLSWRGVLHGQRLTGGDLESMLDVDTSTRPISERMMRRFLEGGR